MPKRIDFTAKELRQIEYLARFHTHEQIADILEIGSRTLRRKMQTDPRALAAYKKGRGKLIGVVARSLVMNAIGGNVTAQIFFLKCQAGWRETDPKQLPIDELPKLTDKELEREKRRMGIVR